MEDYNRRNISDDFDYSYDLVNSFLGDFIAEGSSRVVYDCPIFDNSVVKVAKNGSIDNILEQEFYFSLYHKDSVKWLAPVIWMSKCGKFLVQRKVKPIDEKNKKLIPEKIPAFLTDIKFSNFGFIGKQFVCVDYAFSIAQCSSNHTRNMKKFKSHLGEKL